MKQLLSSFLSINYRPTNHHFYRNWCFLIFWNWHFLYVKVKSYSLSALEMQLNLVKVGRLKTLLQKWTPLIEKKIFLFTLVYCLVVILSKFLLAMNHWKDSQEARSIERYNLSSGGRPCHCNAVLSNLHIY